MKSVGLGFHFFQCFRKLTSIVFASLLMFFSILRCGLSYCLILINQGFGACCIFNLHQFIAYTHTHTKRISSFFFLSVVEFLLPHNFSKRNTITKLLPFSAFFVSWVVERTYTFVYYLSVVEFLLPHNFS